MELVIFGALDNRVGDGPSPTPSVVAPRYYSWNNNSLLAFLFGEMPGD